MKPRGPLVVSTLCGVCLTIVVSSCGGRRIETAPEAPPAPVPIAEAAPQAPSPEPIAAAPAPEAPRAPEAPEAPEAPLAPTASCYLLPSPGDPITTIGLVDRIDPSHAPYPENESERLLFGQIYESLVRLDCDGRVRPAVAASWKPDADGHSWVVTLRDNAHFVDGSQVTATAIRANWYEDDGSDVRMPARRLVSAVTAIDERTLRITLRHSQSNEPLALAHTDLAISKHVIGSEWPLGTRGVSTPPTEARLPIAESVLVFMRDTLPPLRAVVAPRDPRDLFGAGIDLLVTRDPATLAYAGTLPDFQTVPLEWQRLQVLLQPNRPATARSLSEEEVQRLATDAIRGDTRGASGPYWWNAEGCGDMDVRLQSSALTPRLVYDSGDAATRDLAERLVSSARASTATNAIVEALLPDRPRRDFQRTTASSGTLLLQAMQRGTDAGYVVSVERQPLVPCRELELMNERAPWLTPAAIVPIAETRMHAIVRRGKAGATTDDRGGIVLSAVTEPNR